MKKDVTSSPPCFPLRPPSLTPPSLERVEDDVEKRVRFLCMHNSIFLLPPSLIIAGGAAVGDPEESPGNELRQALEVPALLLREGNHAEGGR